MKCKFNKYVGVALLVWFPLYSFGQSSVQEALEEIERNNTYLKAMRDAADAENVLNKTQVNLPDPEVSFGHNWYTKGSNEREKEISVTQELDWTVLTGQRKRNSRTKNDLVELRYIQDRNTLRLQILQNLIALVHATNWLEELKLRESDATALADAYQKMLEAGETNVLEANRAQLNRVTVHAEVQRAEADREELLIQIKALNGGQKLSHTVNDYGENALPVDFDRWCDEAERISPDLAYVRRATDLSKQELKLARTAYIPNLSVGYAAELSPSEAKHGLLVGLRIPLWQNRNQVKQGKAAAVAAESKEADTRIQFLTELESCYERARSLRQIADECVAQLSRLNSKELLRQALDQGQINVLEYTTELEQYYVMREQALTAERDYQLAYAALQAYTWH